MINHEWIEYHVKKCDAVVPLVAIANPAQYVKDPLKVFELDFESNLGVVRQCAKYKKRIIFPSTSEVYGMSPDRELDEATSNLVYGPIDKQRWIYACSKQLLDRVIFAYGVRDGIDYTLFRPFNWIGPKLDNVCEAKEGSSRLFTQFIANVIFRKPIQLVDGGKQSRSFTFIDDGVDCPAAHHREPERASLAPDLQHRQSRELRQRGAARQVHHRRLQALPGLPRARCAGARSSPSPRRSTSASTIRTSRNASRPSPTPESSSAGRPRSTSRPPSA